MPDLNLYNLGFICRYQVNPTRICKYTYARYEDDIHAPTVWTMVRQAARDYVQWTQLSSSNDFASPWLN